MPKPGDLVLRDEIVFGGTRWQITPLPSWEPETDSVALDAFEQALQSAAGSLDTELVGVWHPGGSERDAVQVVHYTYSRSLADDAFSEAFLNAHADSYRASGANVTAPAIEWTRTTGGFRAATLEMTLDTGGSVTHEAFTLVHLDDTVAVIAARSSKSNKALMAAWGAANSLRATPSW